MIQTASAQAHPNIAFIKYWGLKDEENRIPANDSISMNIGSLTTRTTVTFDPSLDQDEFILNNQRITGKSLTRTQQFMDRVRQISGDNIYARIVSENDFPTGAGVASSASGFAALALAAAGALGLDLSDRELSGLARFGSGSACRSIPGGFVEWHTDPEAGESFAESIAPANHWQLMDCIAILSERHKSVGSQAGMRLAKTSPLQKARVMDSERRLTVCRSAILNRDFDTLAKITELDSNMMHAVMMTSDPPLFYWDPQSLAIMKAVKDWQKDGMQVTYTLDAGPNVHVICTPDALDEVLARLRRFPGVVDVLHSGPGGPARLIPNPDQAKSSS